MNHLVKVEKILKKHRKIWNKIISLIKKKLNSVLVIMTNTLKLK